MGALANLPVGMAPGMGLNAYVCACGSYPRGALIRSSRASSHTR